MLRSGFTAGDDFFLGAMRRRGIAADVSLRPVPWRPLRAVRRLPPGPGEAKFLLNGGVAVVIAIMLAGVFEMNLGDSEVLTLFLAAVACAYAAWDQVPAAAAAPAPPPPAI